MNTNNNETLAKDIRDLAQSLLDSSTVGKIIRNVGKFKNFTEEEENIVKEVAGNAEFLKVFDPQKQNWIIGGNIDLAIGVARRVAEGEFSSVDDSLATELILENMMSDGMTDKEWRDRQIDFEDYYQVLKEYMQTVPDLHNKIKQYHHEIDTTGNYDTDGRDPVLIPPLKIQRRYGIIKLPHYWTIAGALFNRDININDREMAENFIKQIAERHERSWIKKGKSND